MPRTFHVDDESRDELQPEEFTVTGTHKLTGEPFTETFSTVVDLVPAVLDDVSASVTIGDDGEAYYQRHYVLQFLHAAVAPADRPRWDALVRDPDRLVRLDMLVTIMHWLVGALTDRPTGPSSNSQAGSTGTDNGSEALSSSQDTTPATSEG